MAASGLGLRLSDIGEHLEHNSTWRFLALLDG